MPLAEKNRTAYMRAMENSPNRPITFLKMHGLGNDFVVIDRREGGPELTADLVRAIGNRHTGVGFDQLATIDTDEEALARLSFWNSDGSVAGACGNATRCIARYLIEQTGLTSFNLLTERGLLACEEAGGGLTRVNMGAPLLDWDQIPLSHEMDTLHLAIEGDPVATGMGNPHITFFVPDASAVDLAGLGAKFEHHPFYPQRTNVEFVEVLGPNAIRLKIWERGAGITLASGTCSCAAAVAAARRGLTERRVTVYVDGGQIGIDWRDDGVWMTAPTAHVFTATLAPDFAS